MRFTQDWTAAEGNVEPGCPQHKTLLSCTSAWWGWLRGAVERAGVLTRNSRKLVAAGVTKKTCVQRFRCVWSLSQRLFKFYWQTDEGCQVNEEHGLKNGGEE